MDEGVSRQEYSKRYPFDHSPQELLSVEQCICEPSYQGWLISQLSMMMIYYSV